LKEENMARLAVALVSFLLVAGPALADECKDNAVGKDGKPLAGAALRSSLNKCRHDACDVQAVSGTDGKKLAGAAYKSFMTKCQKDAAAS
jgi:hypothetical protein